VKWILDKIQEQSGVTFNFPSEKLTVINRMIIPLLTRNDSQKLYDKYRINFTGDGVLKKEFPEENINCLNWGDNLYYFSKGIRIEKRIDGNLISAPSLFKGNEWSSFKHQSPELYKEALEKLREYVVVSKRACNKLFELEETLENKNLTLTALKTNFIELYNILKS
jgi:hypothetical protein